VVSTCSPDWTGTSVGVSSASASLPYTAANWINQHLPERLERLAFDARDASRFQKLGGRIENGQEPLRYHVVKLLFRLGQILRRLGRGMIAKVIGNLASLKMRLFGFTQPLFKIVSANWP